MIRTRIVKTAALTFIVVAGALGCGAEGPDRAASSDRSTGCDGGSTTLTGRQPNELPGIGESVNYISAESVGEWLTGAKVTDVFTAHVVDVEVGPAVTTVSDDNAGLSVTNTALLQVEVGETFLGSHQTGDVVPIVLEAGSGTVISGGDPVPFESKHSTPLSEFEATYPACTRVVLMSSLDDISVLQGSDFNSVVHPKGVERRVRYFVPLHPQAVSVEVEQGRMSGWSDWSYDELVADLRAATR